MSEDKISIRLRRSIEGNDTKIARLEQEIEILKTVVESIIRTQEDHNEVLAALVGMPPEDEICVVRDIRETDENKH